MLTLSDQVFVSGQITEDDVRGASAHGITDIIINRPDGEEMGQPDTDTLAAIAAENGISFHRIPMMVGSLSADQIDATAEALTRAKGKVWAFCKSGGRSAALWALGSVKNGSETPESAISKAAEAGYDLSGLAPLLGDIARS